MSTLVVVSFETKADTLVVLSFQELDESGSESSIIGPGSSAGCFVTQDGAVQGVLEKETSFFGISFEGIPRISELMSSPGATAQETRPAEYASIIGATDKVFKFW